MTPNGLPCKLYTIRNQIRELNSTRSLLITLSTGYRKWPFIKHNTVTISHVLGLKDSTSYAVGCSSLAVSHNGFKNAGLVVNVSLSNPQELRPCDNWNIPSLLRALRFSCPICEHRYQSRPFLESIIQEAHYVYMYMSLIDKEKLR